MDVLLQFVQNHQNVLVVGYLRQHFQLLQLHVKWVVIIHEKDLEFLGKKQWSLLQDKVDRLENKVADLIFTRNHGNQGSTDFVVVCSDGFSV